MRQFLSKYYYLTDPELCSKIDKKRKLLKDPKSLMYPFNWCTLGFIVYEYVPHLITSDHLTYIIDQAYPTYEFPDGFLETYASLLTPSHMKILVNTVDCSLLCSLITFNIHSDWCDEWEYYFDYYADDDPVVEAIELLESCNVCNVCNLTDNQLRGLLRVVTDDELESILIHTNATLQQSWLTDEQIIRFLKYLPDDNLLKLGIGCGATTVLELQQYLCDLFTEQIFKLCTELANKKVPFVYTYVPLVPYNDLIKELKKDVDYYSSILELCSY